MIILFQEESMSGQLRGVTSPRIVEYPYDQSVSFEPKYIPIQEQSDTFSLLPRIAKKLLSQQKALVYNRDPKEFQQEKVLARVIPGQDGRQQVMNTTAWPYSIHVQLTIEFDDDEYGGSGVIVGGPQHVLTCGHNIFDEKKKRWAKSITVYPALNGQHAPFGKVSVAKVYTYSDWTQNGDRRFDIAVLVLSEPIGRYTGWGGVVCTPDAAILEEQIHITGYPGDKGLRQMWGMSHQVSALSAEELAYKIDTNRGQSGSAIWVHKFGLPMIVGIHTLGGDDNNAGVRISPQKFHDLIAPVISMTYKLKVRPLPVLPPFPADPIPGPALMMPPQAAVNPSASVGPVYPYGSPLMHQPLQPRLPSPAPYISSPWPPINPSSPALSRPGSSSTPLSLYVIQALNAPGRGRALIQAVDEENIPAIEYLLSQDTPLTATDGMGRTPLFAACQKKNPVILTLLIRNGAPVGGDDARAALKAATENGDRDIVRILVTEGAPMMEKQGPKPRKIYADSCTPCIPLEIVVRKGDVEMLRIFLSTMHQPNGMKLDAPTSVIGSYPSYGLETVGTSAIRTALANGHLEIARLLVENADVAFLQTIILETKEFPSWGGEVTHSFKYDILFLACEKDNLETVQLLIQKTGLDLERVGDIKGDDSNNRTMFDQHKPLLTLRQRALTRSRRGGRVFQFLQGYR